MRAALRGAILLCLCFSLCACTRPINRAAERRIREALPNLLGPARQYRVHVVGAPLDTVSGKLSAVTIDADDLQLPNGLLLDHLRLDLQDVDYDTGRRRLRKIGTTTFRVDVGQATLDEYLAGEAPPGESLRKVRVGLRSNNQVAISGERVTLGVGVPFQLTGPLRVAGPTRIEFDPKQLSVIGVPIPGFLLDFLKGHFESAVDLAGLPFPVRLTGVTSSSGRLSLTGVANVDALTRLR